MGTAAIIQEMLPTADGTFRLVVQGICRFKISEVLTIDPYLLARVEEAPEIEATGREVELWARHARSEYQQLLSLTANLPSELAFDLAGITGARELAYMAASTSTLSVSDKQELLELDSVSLKLRRLVELLRAARREREHCLRAQLKTIHEQLGEPDPVRNEASELEARLIQAELPVEHAAEIHSELRRFATLPLASPERGSIATYLDWMASLPWRRHVSQPIDIERARQLLDRDHYALDDIKSRVLEHLAVQRLRALREGRERDPGRSPILCLVGPPGIGKTSLGESIARAVGRAFVRISLGGIHDEAEIRGHRRTYVGAMPGRIIQAVRRAQVSNPVCFCSTRSTSWETPMRGNPAAALLEVLDPAENRTFVDNYLAVPFDLSRIMFICTANSVDGLPAALLDRLEVLMLPGYTEADKLHIARRHLLPARLDESGLREDDVVVEEEALRAIIRGYTREAGVRGLGRQLGQVLRRAALAIAGEHGGRLEVDAATVRSFLGRPRFSHDARDRTDRSGVATGLAWTEAGGRFCSSRPP